MTLVDSGRDPRSCHGSLYLDLKTAGSPRYKIKSRVQERRLNMEKPPRPQPFVLASTDHGPMILNHLDYRVDGERIFGVGYELLRDGSFSQYEVGIAKALLDWRREEDGDGLCGID